MAEEKHAQNRLRVCFGCFEKVKPGEDVFSCTDAVRERIKLKVPSYDFDDSRVPVGFCEGCKRKLKDVEKGTLKELDLSNLNSYLATQPKSSQVKCAKPCKVCSVAEKIGLDSRSQGNGNKRKKGGRPSTHATEEVVDCCGKCFSPKKRGLSHDCSETSKLSNILTNSTPHLQGRIASSVVKSLSESEGSKDILLPTGGPPLPIHVGKVESSEIQITHEDMDHLQAEANLTATQLTKGSGEKLRVPRGYITLWDKIAKNTE